jgi:hypothetical protein
MTTGPPGSVDWNVSHRISFSLSDSVQFEELPCAQVWGPFFHRLTAYEGGIFFSYHTLRDSPVRNFR